MSQEDTLANLMIQAHDQGTEFLTLKAIVEESSELATLRTLDRLGLADAGAQDDLDELRELLRAWRDAKASAWKALIEWVVRALLAALLIGIAVRFGIWNFR